MKDINQKLKQVNVYKLKNDTLKITVSICRAIFIIAISFVILYPLIDMFSTAFTELSMLGDPSSVYIPIQFSTDSFAIANDLVEFGKTIPISLLYASIVTLLQILSSALVGYGFARFKFRGKNILFALVILTIVIPPETLLIPEYLSLRYFDFFGLISLITGSSLNLLGSPIVLFLKPVLGAGIRGGLFIFIFRQFFAAMPKELEEASMVDGASVFQTFYKIMLPSSMPAVMTVGVFGFIWNYSDTGVSIFLNNNILIAQRLISELSPSKIEGAYNTFYNLNGNETNILVLGAIQDASIIIFLLPLLILYFIVQRRFVENFERAGIVG